MLLAHMWQFEHMSKAAFKAYTALPDVTPVEKITMRRQYDFPRKDLLEVYLEICKREKPLSVDEGNQIGLEALALIAQTRQELALKWGSWEDEILKEVVNHNLIELKPCYQYNWRRNK